ncbi:hypothetical protein ES702_07698 [subsurface metagenome]
MGIFSVIGTIGKAIFGGGGEKTTTSTAQINYKQMLEDQKADFTRQMDIQAQQGKKTVMMIAIAGGGLVLILVIFMMMRK